MRPPAQCRKTARAFFVSPQPARLLRHCTSTAILLSCRLAPRSVQVRRPLCARLQARCCCTRPLPRPRPRPRPVKVRRCHTQLLWPWFPSAPARCRCRCHTQRLRLRPLPASAHCHCRTRQTRTMRKRAPGRWLLRLSLSSSRAFDAAHFCRARPPNGPAMAAGPIKKRGPPWLANKTWQPRLLASFKRPLKASFLVSTDLASASTASTNQ